MYPFEYHRPGTLKDVGTLLRKEADAKLIAGGQTLLPVLRLRLARTHALIDLAKVEELRGITVSGTNLIIGAMTRHAEVAASKDVLLTIPSLARLAGGIGDRQVRNLGTIGGSLANNDPAADYPAALLGLNGTVVTNKRRIPADKFIVGMMATALKPGELITQVSFPMVKRAAYAKFANPASRFALVGVFVSEIMGSVRVAVTGAAPSAFRVPAMEKVLAAKFAPEAIARVKVPPDNLNSDLHASAEYRAHLIAVMAQRAVEAAISGK
jgi:aerobic carbon-monoxide dehydrogenase medium subunit